MPSQPPAHIALSLRMLALAYFVQATGALSVIGALDVVAHEWSLSDTEAVYLISAFGTTFALAAPMLQMLVGHIQRRRQVLMGLGLFSGAALLFASAPNYPLLLVARVLMGMGAGLIGPVLGALGASMVEKDHQGSAIATVLMGLSLSSLLGLPAASWLAHAYGPRALFAVVAAAGILCALLIRLHVPDESVGERVHVATVVSLLTQGRSVSAFLVVFFLATSVFTSQSMLSPIVRDVYHADAHVLATALLVLGGAGVLGNAFVGRMARQFSAERMLQIGMTLLAGSLVMLKLSPPHLPLLYAALALFAFATDILWPSQQRRIIEVMPAQRGVALALTSSFVFCGIGLGSTIAGWVYPVTGFTGTLFASAMFLGLSMLCLRFSMAQAQKTCAYC